MEKPTGFIQKIIESLQQVNALDVYSPIEKDIILHNLRAAYMTFLNISVETESTESRVDEIEMHCEGESRKLKADNEIEEGEEKREQYEMTRQFEDEVSEDEVLEDEVSEDEVSENDVLENEVVGDECEAEVVPEFSEDTHENPYPIEASLVEGKIEVVETVEDIVAVRSEHESASKKNDEEPIIQEFIEKDDSMKPSLIEEDSFVEESSLVIDPIMEIPTPLRDDILEFIPNAQPLSGLLFEEKSIPKTEKKSLNDLLTEKKEEQTLGVRFQQSHIPDITKAIAINEKFTFIRELFRNSGVDFSNAIQKLNECENIDDAFVLMETLKHQYLWDTTSTSYLSLCDLVRRKFL